MSLADSVISHLPQLRRYARALEGSQNSGDAYVRACLEAIVADPDRLDEAVSLRVALYHVFHVIWNSAGVAGGGHADAGSLVEVELERRLLKLTPLYRQALLLTSIEGFSFQDVAIILDVEDDEVERLVMMAMEEIASQEPTNVLVIEDEPIIRLDICGIVEDMGHAVAAVATTRDEAVTAARRYQPGLVLADIHLADGSSGIDAVQDILSYINAPIVFITAFPERLLTGERPEPTFLVTKPFVPESVKTAISQALFMDAARRAAA